MLHVPSSSVADLQRLALYAREWRRRALLDPKLPPRRPGWPIVRHQPEGEATVERPEAEARAAAINLRVRA